MASKELEREYLRRFASARADLGIEVAEAGESPDFLVRRDKRIVGIEVTRYSPVARYGVFVPEEQEGLRARVMERSRRLYEASGGLPLHVSALFNEHRPLRRPRVKDLSQEFADFLLLAARDTDVYKVVPFTPTAKPPNLKEIGHVTAIRVPAPDYGLWYAREGAWVRDAEAGDFTRLLASKERRLADYRAQCDEVWLLVVFETLPGGEYVQGPSATNPPTLVCGFDRVFALERVTSRCVELPVRRAG